MNVAIVGYGVEGRTSAAYFAAGGHTVTICDKNAQAEVSGNFGTQFGYDYLANLDRFDVIVRSAGIHPGVILDKNPTVGPKITTAVNEFLAHSPTKHVIGVTGTKGKGTTSTLVTKMLEAAGQTTWLGGNIGNSPLEFIQEVAPDDWVVLELSSFQLYDLKYSPHIAVCLMVVPEHLDWHKNFDDYITAKSNLFRQQTNQDIAIYYGPNDTSRRIANVSPGNKIAYFESAGAFVNGASEIEIDGSIVCSTNDIKLLGTHNWQNACAAVTAVWSAGYRNVEAIKSVLTSFEGLPHRLEFVRELEGVKYYNDSFAATPDASMAALNAIPGNKVVIVGGFDRGLPLEHFANALTQHTSSVTPLFIGDSAGRLAAECVAVGLADPTISRAKTMKEIVEQARYMVEAPGSVVLSPGFASFDMFKNFEDRGKKFKKAVANL